MTRPRNILFIMADQILGLFVLLWRFLSTPNIDQLAKEVSLLTGPIANLPYVDLPACLFTQVVIHSLTELLGMEFKSRRAHFGRFYERSWLSDPLVGKTHFYPDLSGLKRIGIELDSPLAN